jgi:hypothetical protein
MQIYTYISNITTFLYIHTHTYTCMSTFSCIHTHIYRYISTYMCICVYVYICMCVYVDTCTYIQIYQCVRIYVHTATCKINGNRSDGVPVVNWYKAAVENRWKFPCILQVAVHKQQSSYNHAKCGKHQHSLAAFTWHMCVCVYIYIYIYIYIYVRMLV